MAHHIDGDDSSDDDYVDSEEEEEEENRRFGGSGKKRGRSNSDSASRGGKKRNSSGSMFIDDVAEVDEDDEADEGEEEEIDDFLENGETDLPAEEETGHRRQRRFRDDEDDVEKFDDKYFQERYSRLYPEYDDDDDDDDDDDHDELDQQALLPSVRDPKLWKVNCAKGLEREVAVCLMQKFMDRGSDFKIRSVIALDNLQSYIYVEADTEAHVKEAIKGIGNINANHKILLVPVREMTGVLTVQSKAIDLSRDTWVRMKRGMYKGDLAQVVDVDNVSRTVTVKIIPRIDLQVLANKLEGREIVKKKAFVPPPRFMNIDAARELHIRVEHRRDRMTGDYFENIDGMLFKDGFLYKKVSTKSITAQNVTPTLDELEKFKKPSENGEIDFCSANRKKGLFRKGDAVIVIKGDLKNLKGWVEKVDEETVHIRSEMNGLPNPVAVTERELCKYFEPGNLVKVISGTQVGATGMVIKADQHVVIILSDTTKEHIRVFADHVIKSAEVTNGVTKIVDSFSRSGNFKTPPSPRRFQRADMGYNSAGAGAGAGRRQQWGGRGARGNDLLVGTYVKVRKGPFKGYRGRLVEVKDKTVRMEHEAKIVTVDRDAISNMTDNEITPSQYKMGSQTPMHPSRTPLHPYMTPMRDFGATPIHDGMRTPMGDRAWNPCTPMTPSRDNWEDGNPVSWGTNLQPRSPHLRAYEAPTPGSGWDSSTHCRNYSVPGTPIHSANAPSPCLPSATSQPMTPYPASYLPSTPGGQPLSPGADLDVLSH